MSTWQIWCEWPHESNNPGRHTSGILVCGEISVVALDRDDFFLLSYGITRDSTQIHDYRKIVPRRSSFNVHLAIAMLEASVSDSVESRRGHK